MKAKHIIFYGLITAMIALAFIGCPEPDSEPQCTCTDKVHPYGSPCTCPASGTSACDCTEEQPPYAHTHSYSATWSKNVTQHWHECSCGDKADVADHTAGNWIIDQAATATTDGSKHQECTVCGYVTATETIPATGEGHVHDYGTTWLFNATQHWRECSCGDKTDAADHTGDPCTVCSYSGSGVTETAATPTATPAAGTYPAAQTVTLSTSTPGASIYYTLDGSNPNSSSSLFNSSLLISNSSLLKAIAVKDGMNDSEVMEAEYIIDTEIEPQNLKISIRYGDYRDQLGAFSDIPLHAPLTGPASITIANYDNLNNIEVDDGSWPGLSWFSLTDYDNPQVSYDNLPAIVRNRIIANGITIHLDATAYTSKIDVSLRHIHLLREAFVEKGVPTDKILINAPEHTFTPVFDGREWARVSWYRINWDTGVYKSLFDFYPRGVTELINGIQIAGNPDGSTYRLVYGRAMKVTVFVWEPVQGYDEEGTERSPIIGIGLEKAAGGSIILASDDVYVNPLADWMVYCNIKIDDIKRYENILREHGLHPDNGVFLNLSNVIFVLPVNAPDSATNIAANGILDFMYLYYNPAKDYIDGSDPAIEVKKNRLPGVGFDRRPDDDVFRSFIFDGYATDSNGNYIMVNGKYTPALPAGVTSRNIGGVTINNPLRKGGATGNGITGEPNEDFINNITVLMAKCLASLHVFNARGAITELRNTNIIGDGSGWDFDEFFFIRDGIIIIRSDHIPTIVNVGLIGNYSEIQTIQGTYRGVIDILGNPPYGSIESVAARTGYLNLWNNISHETIVTDFDVVRVHGTGGGNIVTGGIPNIEARLIIYDKRYDSLVVDFLHPHHRAFMVEGIAKLTGGSIPSANTATYQGNSPTSPVPSPYEEDWIKFGNSITTGFTTGVTLVTIPGSYGSSSQLPQLAASYSSLTGDKAIYRITQQEFDALE
jgi:hypothetical protein